MKKTYIYGPLSNMICYLHDRSCKGHLPLLVVQYRHLDFAKIFIVKHSIHDNWKKVT